MGVCVHIGSGADAEDNNGNGDGVGDCDHCTSSTYTSRLATSMSASKLPQTSSLLLAKASTELELVLATGPGNPRAVRVWTPKMGRLVSRTIQKPDLQTLGRPNLDPYLSTDRFRWVWLDPSVPISGTAFRVSHLWSHSDMLLLISKY